MMRAIKVDYTFAYEGYINHNVYFETLGGEGGPATGKIAELINEAYGSFEKWAAEFKATGIAGRVAKLAERYHCKLDGVGSNPALGSNIWRCVRDATNLWKVRFRQRSIDARGEGERAWPQAPKAPRREGDGATKCEREAARRITGNQRSEAQAARRCIFPRRDRRVSKMTFMRHDRSGGVESSRGWVVPGKF